MRTMRPWAVRVIALQIVTLAVLASVIGYLLVSRGDDGADQQELRPLDIEVIPVTNSEDLQWLNWLMEQIEQDFERRHRLSKAVSNLLAW